MIAQQGLVHIVSEKHPRLRLGMVQTYRTEFLRKFDTIRFLRKAPGGVPSSAYFNLRIRCCPSSLIGTRTIDVELGLSVCLLVRYA